MDKQDILREVLWVIKSSEYTPSMGSERAAADYSEQTPGAYLAGGDRKWEDYPDTTILTHF